MFIIIITMFLLDTAICILDVHNALLVITLTLTSTAPLSLADRYAASNIPWIVDLPLFAYMVRVFHYRYRSHIALTGAFLDLLRRHHPRLAGLQFLVSRKGSPSSDPIGCSPPWYLW